MWPLRNIVEGLENGNPPIPSVAKCIPQVGIKLLSQNQNTVNRSHTRPTKQRRAPRDAKRHSGHVNKHSKHNLGLQKPRRPAAAASRPRFDSAANPRERRQRAFERQTNTQKQLLERAVTHLNKRITLVKQIKDGSIEAIVEPMGQQMLRGSSLDAIAQSSPRLRQDVNLEDPATRARKNSDVSNGLAVGEVGSAWTTPGSSIVMTPNESRQGLAEYSGQHKGRSSRC